MLISIVVPLYNKEKYIQRALDSIAQQLWGEFEVLVVDDGSQDDGPAIVAAYPDHRFRLLTQSNQGVSVARNTGLSAARGELIAFLDADDEYYPEFLQTIVGLATRFPHAGAFGTAYAFEQEDGILVYPTFPAAPTEPEGGIFANFFLSPDICSSATAIRANILSTIGVGFRPGVQYGEDLEFWLHIVQHYPIAWSNTLGAVYHAADASDNCRDKKYVGDAPFAHLCTELSGDFFELLCSQRLRTFIPGTYLVGNRVLARHLLAQCRRTRTMRKHYHLWRMLTALPHWLGSFAYRLVFRDFQPFTFLSVYREDHHV